MAKIGVDLKYKQKSKDGQKVYWPSGGQRLLLNSEVAEFCAENGFSINYVDVRHPDLIATAFFSKDDEAPGGGGEKKKPNW